jgi:hypothetical protein
LLINEKARIKAWVRSEVPTNTTVSTSAARPHLYDVFQVMFLVEVLFTVKYCLVLAQLLYSSSSSSSRAARSTHRP